MINFLVSVLMMFMVIFMIIVIVTACILCIAVLDYVFDLDIKGWLTKRFGERTFLKRVREKTEEVVESLDSDEYFEENVPQEPERIIVYPENVQAYMNSSEHRAFLEQIQNDILSRQSEGE